MGRHRSSGKMIDGGQNVLHAIRRINALRASAGPSDHEADSDAIPVMHRIGLSDEKIAERLDFSPEPSPEADGERDDVVGTHFGP